MGRRRTFRLRPFAEEHLRRSAQILGEASAASMALAELAKRRELGQDVSAFLTDDNTILIGPTDPALALKDRP